MKIFIPIKKNSQRVKEKNFRNFLNEPLYKHTLLKLKDFNVFVDTDSEEILSEIESDSRLFHVNGIRRRKDLVGDTVSVCDLVSSWIAEYKIQGNICQIHVTSPFLKVETLFKAMSKISKGFDSVVSCNEIQSRLWRNESYGFCPVNHNPALLEQTQDLPFYYEENSLFYIFDADYFSKTNMRIGKNPFFYKCTFPENIDIDTEDDWEKSLLISEKY